jgi:hypothetical protein
VVGVWSYRVLHCDGLLTKIKFTNVLLVRRVATFAKETLGMEFVGFGIGIVGIVVSGSCGTC